MVVESLPGILGENIRALALNNNGVVRLALMTGLILLLPLIAMQFSDEVNWSPADFVVAGVLLFGAGLTYQLISKRARNFAYRAAVGMAVATGLLLVWASLAVGLIGDEGHPAELMYFGVIAIAISGALVARFDPRGMAKALFATAFAQMCVALIAQTAGLGSTYMVNGFFAALWIGSALLFLRAGAPDEASRAPS